MGTTFGLKFLGTRGLISSPGADKAIFGGNTPCIQIIHGDHLILIDTGFGASNFGEELMKRIIKNKEQLNVHIFFTHFHWDHIQGLPFFHPIYFPTSQLYFYSPLSVETMTRSLDVLFDGSYSPFAGIKNMPSKLYFQQLQGPVCLDGLTFDFMRVAHGNRSDEEHATYAYKITDDREKKSICIITDHEAAPTPINRELIRFGAGVDILVHDAQYTDKEYRKRKGWGHSTMRQALSNAAKMQAGRTLLTHHDPRRTDRELLSLHIALQSEPKFRGVDFEFAREDHVYSATASLSEPLKAAG